MLLEAIHLLRGQTEVPNRARAGRRFAKTKYGRAVVIAILEEWSLICFVAVATGAMIMIAVMLYNGWSAAQ